MPITKLNPLSVAGPRTIVPISSLSPGLEETLAAAQPTLVAALLPVVATRPSLAEYQVTAHAGVTAPVAPIATPLPTATAVPAATVGPVATSVPVAMGPMVVDLSLLLADRHAPTGEIGAATLPTLPVEPIAVDAAVAERPLATPSVAQTSVIGATDLLVGDHAAVGSPLAAVDFQTVCVTAFRMPDSVTLDWHQAVAMPFHDVLPLPGGELLVG